MDPDEALLTVEEVADRLGVSVATVRRRCASGDLKARKVGKSWLIAGDSLPPRPSQRRGRRPRSTSSQVDLPLALTHLRTQDLRQDVWVPDVLRFEDDLRQPDILYLGAAARLDLDEAFDPASYVPVPKSPVFPRNAVDLSLVDRLAYQAAVGVCAPRIERSLTASAYSARLSTKSKYFLENGRDAWLRWRRDVVKALREHGPWMAETDVTAYFDFIKHELLLPELQELGVDASVVGALREMLRTWSVTPNTGLPQGPNASRVLANYYLSPIDNVMQSQPGIRYFRFMDDIRIVGESRARVIAALQELDSECRRRGLALSTKKTELHEGSAAISRMEDDDLDALQYAFDRNDGDDDNALRKDLRSVLKAALKANDQAIDVRRARFSLGRLFRLRDQGMVNSVLDNLEALAPLGEIVPKYLHPFLRRIRVQERLTAFLHDPERNTSVFLSTWLLAVMTDLGPPLPESWIDYARGIAIDRSQAAYHRAIALNVMALGLRPRDFTRLEEVVAREHDPEIVRAAAVALARVGRLSRATAARARRVAGMAGTLDYLAGAASLPSLVFGGRRVGVQR